MSVGATPTEKKIKLKQLIITSATHNKFESLRRFCFTTISPSLCLIPGYGHIHIL